MRLEHIPLVLGALVVLGGVVLLGDAVLREVPLRRPDLRRSARAERNRLGEGLIALGICAVGAVLLGRDTWKWSNVAMLTGMFLLLIGMMLNARYLEEILLNRGPARRRREGSRGTGRTPQRRAADHLRDRLRGAGGAGRRPPAG